MHLAYILIRLLANLRLSIQSRSHSSLICLMGNGSFYIQLQTQFCNPRFSFHLLDLVWIFQVKACPFFFFFNSAFLFNCIKYSQSRVLMTVNVKLMPIQYVLLSNDLLSFALFFLGAFHMRLRSIYSVFN